jgi:hypothetical protein
MRVNEIRPEDRKKYDGMSEPQIRAIVQMRLELYHTLRAACERQPLAAKGYELWNAYVKQAGIAHDRIVKGVLDERAAAELFLEAAHDFLEKDGDGSISDQVQHTIRGLREAKKGNGFDEWPDPDFSRIEELRLPAVLFDWDAVPPSWHDWIKQAAADCGCPVDFTYANLLAIASCAFGNTYRASPWGDWVERPHLWMMNIGVPSSNKTPALDPFLKAARSIEKRAMPKYVAAMQEWQAAKNEFKAELSEWKAVRLRIAKRNDDHRRKREPEEEMPEQPADTTGPEPRPLRLVVGDTTVEELQDLLAHNPRGLTVMRSELSGFMGSFGRYSSNAAPDKAFYLESYDGRTYVVDRRKNKLPIQIPYNSLAVVGGIQPDKLRPMFESKESRDGFTARFVYIYPDSIPPEPRDPSRSSCVGELDAALTKLWHLSFDEDYNHREIPHVIRLDAEAAKILQAVRQEAYQADKEGADAGIVIDWRGKNGGRLLRLALIIEMLIFAKSDRPHPYNTGNQGQQTFVISGQSAAMARRYLTYCQQMMYRALGELAATDAQRDAGAIGRHILRNNLATINERDLYRSEGFHQFRKEAVRKAAFKTLADAAWLRKARKPAPKGGRPSGEWEVNPKVFGPHGD